MPNVSLRTLSVTNLFIVLALTLPASLTLAQAMSPDQQLARQAHSLQEKRCMVCHGCFDAPCQLKLEAAEGLTRGASKALVYNGTRLITGEMTRLFDDGYNEQQWRDKGFYSVLDQQHPEKGVLHKMLELKKAHPLPPSGPLADSFDLRLNRDQQCPKPEEFDQYAKDYPLWGMPYGFPGLQEQEHQLMTQWLARGAPAPDRPPLSPGLAKKVAQWESFLNGPSNKERLMSRYLFEHLFLAGLYLEEGSNPVWFRMVRSHTKPGRNIGFISTRRPYDDPRTDEFYYRLQRMPLTILDKRHMLYRFDETRMEWYRDLFLGSDYTVARLPSYETDIVRNPFKRFEAIPASTRYRFLLEESQFTIMNFIKGPVCRGQIALNVIADHFWVMFVNPNAVEADSGADFLASEADNLRLPVAVTGTPVDLFRWRRYAKAEQAYAAAKADHLEETLNKIDRNLDIDDIWDGEDRNDNAALTIFRHFDTASVVKGFVGETPKTAWVIDYPMLERIHYLLVAGFDVYGGASHQLESRLYMDFLRMEGEYNFLMFLPPEERVKLRDYWYRGARDSVREHYFSTSEVFTRQTDVKFTTDDPKTEFLQMMRKRLHGAQAEPYNYHSDASAEMIAAFEKLEANIGVHNSFVPHVNFLNVIGENRDQMYTIIRNSARLNYAQPFDEQSTRLPREDSLTVVRGFIGAYPNNFFQVDEKNLESFVEDIANMGGEEDQDRVLDLYGVRRNAPWFWRLSDKFQSRYRERDGIRAGIFDFNRYHNHQ